MPKNASSKPPASITNIGALYFPPVIVPRDRFVAKFLSITHKKALTCHVASFLAVILRYF